MGTHDKSLNFKAVVNILFTKCVTLISYTHTSLHRELKTSSRGQLTNANASPAALFNSTKQVLEET